MRRATRPCRTIAQSSVGSPSRVRARWRAASPAGRARPTRHVVLGSTLWSARRRPVPWPGSRRRVDRKRGCHQDRAFARSMVATPAGRAVCQMAPSFGPPVTFAGGVWLRCWGHARSSFAQVPRHPVDRRRQRSRRLYRDAHRRRLLRLPDHAVDDDGDAFRGGRCRRQEEPVGHAADLPRARVGALVGVGGRGLRPRRRPRDELHRRPGPRADEGSPARHFGQAAAGRLPRRRPGAHQPGAQHPCRP